MNMLKKFKNKMEQVLDIDLDGDGAIGAPIPSGVPANLPDNWSARVDPHSGRTYYLNHNNGKTQWHPPPAPANPATNPHYQPAGNTVVLTGEPVGYTPPAAAVAAAHVPAAAAAPSAPPAQSQGMAPKFCSECGSKLAAGARFCAECGQRIEGAQAGGGGAGAAPAAAVADCLPVAELDGQVPFSSFQGSGAHYAAPSVGYTSAQVQAGAFIKPSGTRKALLVGCNYPGTSAELGGCVNDVHNMRDLLAGEGFPPMGMTILTDDGRGPPPTRANILKGFEWLVSGAQPGDVLFFHFSGHGSQVRDESGMEEDGYNETICPCDYDRAGQIVDDEIWSRLVYPLPSGVRLTALMDCCHSGTGLDLPFTYSVRAGRWIEDENPSFAAGDVQMFSGCQDDQCSSDGDVMLFKTGGAMTNAFIRAYKSSPTPLLYPEFMSRLHSELRNRGFSQHPQLTSSQAFDLRGKPFSIKEGIVANMNPQVGRVQRRKIRPARNFGSMGGIGPMEAMLGGMVGLSLLDAIF